MKPVKRSEKITHEEQLTRWVRGESIHRLDDALGGGECCPDFSCCNPELLVEKATRRAFADANENERMVFLGLFIRAAIAAAGGEVL